MISEKQLHANRQNALRSTGPRTAAGKGVSSQNALRHGLRADQIVILGENCQAYEQFYQELIEQIAPIGALESQLAEQIAVAFWKLRRADRNEGDLLPQMQDAEQMQQRASAKRLDEGVLLPSVASKHRVSFEDARNAWFRTEEGIAYNKNEWPVDPRCPTPVQTFDGFWDELDQRALEKLNQQVQETSQPLDPSPSEPVRADLSYEIMLEQRKTVGQSPPDPDKADAAIRTGSVPRPIVPFAESMYLGKAFKEDFSGPKVILKFSRYRTQSERTLYRALNELNKLQYLRRQRQAIDVQGSKDETG